MKQRVLKSSLFAGIVGVLAVAGIACGGGVAQSDFDTLSTKVDGIESDVTALTGRVATLEALAAMLTQNGGMAPSGMTPPTTTPGTPAAATDRLDVIKERGRLICGVQSQTPGFGNLATPREGHDADYCRAIAAAIFGTVNEGSGGNLEFINATGSDRFERLSQGSIDVLVRTTTWTSGRDATLGAAFTATTFFDGAGIMISPTVAAEGVNSARELDGRTICVRAGTSTLDALNDFAEINDIEFTTMTGDDDATLLAAFNSGACDGFSSDQSQLAGIRSGLTGDLAESVILPDLLSKEPLGPSTHESGGFEWFDAVQWINYGLITAEEEGITQANLDEMVALGADGLSPTAARVLGLRDDFNIGGGKLNGDTTFMQDVIRAVGNYGEIYARNLEPIGLTRACSAQALWNPPESAWADCDGDGEMTLFENRGLIQAPRYGG